MHVCKIFFDNTIRIAYMQHNELIKLGNHIKNLRLKRGLTISALCYRNALEPSTISRIEAGLVEAKYLTLVKVAKAFDIQLAELFDFE